MNEELQRKLRVACALLQTAYDTPATLRSRRNRLIMEARKEIAAALKLLEGTGDERDL